jgi:hypothetical protein
LEDLGARAEVDGAIRDGAPGVFTTSAGAQDEIVRSVGVFNVGTCYPEESLQR